jgi:hypothetical protein
MSDLAHLSTAQNSTAANRPVSTPRIRPTPSPLLVWSITTAEALLWCTGAWFFADYWMMLPIRFRWAGGLILGTTAAIGLLRLFLFYRRRSRNPQP